MRKFSISDKLILASLFLSIITIIIVASYSFYNAREAILDRTFNQLTSVKAVKSSMLENFFKNRVREVQLITTTSDIQNIVAAINELPEAVNYRIIDDLNSDISKVFLSNISSKDYSNISVVGNNNVVYKLKYSGELLPGIYQDYNSLSSGFGNSEPVVINDLTKPDSLSSPIITISSIISNNENQTIGIIVFEISQSSIDSIMLEMDQSKGFGITGESYLVGPDFLMRSSSRFQSHSVLSTVVKTDAVIKAFNNNPGIDVIDDYRGVSVLSSYGKINVPNLDWVILAEIDFEEATVPIYRIRDEIVFISIFIFLLVLSVVFILSRRITFPIQRLNVAAAELGKGNFNVKIEHKLNDELGDLSDTFNTMVTRLKEQSEELESERDKSLNSLIDGQESERQRLSRELHDSLGQLLIALKLKYESCLIKTKSGKLPEDSLSELGLLFDKTIDETRRISNNLMPAALSEFGLTTALRNICNDISENSDIHVELNISGDSSDLGLKQKIYLFRIAQEAITNILKHSGALTAGIEIDFGVTDIRLTVQDDGIGFKDSVVDYNKSNGLNNIKDRVMLLNGIFTMNSKPDEGTKITIRIPNLQDGKN